VKTELSEQKRRSIDAALLAAQLVTDGYKTIVNKTQVSDVEALNEMARAVMIIVILDLQAAPEVRPLKDMIKPWLDGLRGTVLGGSSALCAICDHIEGLHKTMGAAHAFTPKASPPG